MIFATSVASAAGRFRLGGPGGWLAALLVAGSAIALPLGAAADAPPPAAESGPEAPATEPPEAVKSSFARAIREIENEDALRQRERKEETETKGWGLSEMLALAALLAAVGLALRLALAMRGGPSLKKAGREMRLVDRLALDRQSELLIVRVRGRDYWLAKHPGGLALLAELPEPVAPAETPNGPEESPTGKKLPSP